MLYLLRNMILMIFLLYRTIVSCIEAKKSVEFKFSIKILKISQPAKTETWINVFRFTEKCNKENDGDRIPSLFIHNDNGKGKFLVSSYVEGQIKNTDFEFVLGEKYHIKIQQFKDEDNGKKKGTQG